MTPVRWARPALAAMFAAPLAQAAVDAQGAWTPGIGDPTLIGWLTLVLYLAAAGLAARNAVAATRTAVPRGFWVLLGVLMLALGINKQLDLQTWFGLAGRDLAMAQGWYEQRRAVQAVFIALLCAAALALLWAARRQWAALWGEYRLAFIGICLLALFIVVRAATFHHIDQVLRIDLGGARLSAVLEIAGILVVAAGCAWWQHMHRRRVQRLFMQRALRR